MFRGMTWGARHFGARHFGAGQGPTVRVRSGNRTDLRVEKSARFGVHKTKRLTNEITQ